jgi:AraC-like DNA-binding protein
MTLIRATALQGFPDLVRSRGGDPDALLRGARIPRAAVGQFDAYLGFRNVISLIESAASATGTPGFGRLLACQQGMEIFGPLGATARTARTVAEAFAAFRDYVSVYSPSLEVSRAAHHDDRYVIIEMRITLTPAPVARQYIELALGVLRRVISLLAGKDFRPVVVHVPHDPIAPEQEYARYFAAPVRFREPFWGITIHRADFDRPISKDTGAHDSLRAYLDSITGSGMPDLTETVLRLIRHLLPIGALSVDLVADQLGMHPRTLQRRLAEQSTTYGRLLDQTRKDLASRMLRDTDMPLTQLAGVLGYSEQSVLTASCRRWFDTTPARYRTNIRVATSNIAP